MGRPRNDERGFLVMNDGKERTKVTPLQILKVTKVAPLSFLIIKRGRGWVELEMLDLIFMLACIIIPSCLIN